MPQGSWLMAHGQDKLGARARGQGTQDQFVLAMSHEAWALSHEPLTIIDRLIYALFDYLFWVLGIN